MNYEGSRLQKCGFEGLQDRREAGKVELGY